MERELPRYMIGRDEFEVDMRAGELRLLADRSKSLSLFKMDGKGDKLEFLYDHVLQKMVLPGYKISPDGNQLIEKIKLPVAALDPDFHKAVEQETKEAEQLIRSGKSVYSRAGGIHAWIGSVFGKPGLLPMVNLYGTEFFLDLRMKELRQVDNHANAIPFMALAPEEFHFTLFYDTTAKNAFKGSFREAIERDDIKALLLPPLDKMVKDGVRRHEQKIRSSAKISIVPEPPLRSRRKGRGI